MHWRASRDLVHKRPPASSEAVVVLEYRNKSGIRANAPNRWRVRAALRSIYDSVPSSVLVCSGTSVAVPVAEAVLLARYAVDERGFTGTVLLESESRTTWENVRNVIALIEDMDQIKIVSNSLHAQKARLYVARYAVSVPARRPRFGSLAAMSGSPTGSVAGALDMAQYSRSCCEPQSSQPMSCRPVLIPCGGGWTASRWPDGRRRGRV